MQPKKLSTNNFNSKDLWQNYYKIIPPPTPTKRKWVWRWGDWRLYITHHCALKQKEKHQPRHRNEMAELKSKLVMQRGQVCELCGKPIERYCKTQIHHIIPWNRYPEGELDDRNLMVLCSECHAEVHANPILNAGLICQAATKIGVDVKKYFNYKYNYD
jgi:5-methylcytosine-specific restriction endonuclease McrA